MNKLFLLTLPVIHKNCPNGLPDWDTKSVRVTLRHTLAHIRHLVWELSANCEPRPTNFQFLFRSGAVSDDLLLSEILSVEDPDCMDTDHGLVLVIDYTLITPPVIGMRDPDPELFDVEVEYQKESPPGETLRCFLRESLFSSVLSVREFVLEKFGLESQNLDLVYNGQALLREIALSEVLGLDVPPLDTVRFDLKETNDRYPVSVEAKAPHESLSSFKLYVEKDVLVFEFKAEIARHVGVNAHQLELYIRQHCFSRACCSNQLTRLSEVIPLYEDTKAMARVLYVVNTKAELHSNAAEPSSWKENERQLNEDTPEEFEQPNMELALFASEIYELEVRDRVYQFTTAECIRLNDGLLLNAPAMARLALLGVDLSSIAAAQLTYKVVGPSSQVCPERTETSADLARPSPQATSLAQPTRSGNLEAIFTSSGPVSTPLELQLTVGSHETQPGASTRNENGEPSQEHERIEPTQREQEQDPQIQEESRPRERRVNGTALGAIMNILIENRIVILQLVLQVGFTMFLMGGDLFLELLDPAVLFVLGTTSSMAALFIFGVEISDWIDQQVLMRGNEELLDYALLRCVSISFRSATSLNERISRAISQRVVRTAVLLHQTRLERLEDQVLSNVFKSTAKRLFLQILQACFMGVATVFPYIEHDLNQIFDDEHSRDSQGLKKRIQKSLQRIQVLDNQAAILSTVQAQLRVPIHTLADIDAIPGRGFLNMSENENDEDVMERARAEENVDLLRCYLLLRWLEHHADASELPLSLRRQH